MAALLFVPAGTFDYWQAYVFMAVFVGGSAAITVYLAIKDPQLLERRMRAGPTAEKETTQKIIMVFALLGFIALLVVPALDRRFTWSSVPPRVSLIGDLLVALGFLLVYVVIRENSYAASTIQVAEGQTVISTGPYAVVRHPIMPECFLCLSAPHLRSARGTGSSRSSCLCQRSYGGFSMRKDSCTRICRDIRSIPAKYGIDWCRLSGRSMKNELRRTGTTETTFRKRGSIVMTDAHRRIYPGQ